MTDIRQLKDHLDYPDEVKEIVWKHQYDNLLKFTNFSLCKLIYDLTLLNIIRNANKIVIKYVIDNVIDINVSLSGYNLVHFLVDLKHVELFNYIVDKYNIDLNAKSVTGHTPIFFACNYGTLEMIDFLLNRDINVELEINGYQLIHDVCCYRDYSIIKKLFSKIINLNDSLKKHGLVDYNVKDLLESNQKLTSEQLNELLDIVNKKIELCSH